MTSQVEIHSSDIGGLCVMKLSSGKPQNLPYENPFRAEKTVWIFIFQKYVKLFPIQFYQA